MTVLLKTPPPLQERARATVKQRKRHTRGRRGRLQAYQPPVILYGSVRAGTTMFRLMMGSHPDLTEVGENQYLIDGLRDAGADRLSYDTQWLSQERVFRMRNLTCPDGQDGRELLDTLLDQLRAGRSGPLVITFHAGISVLRRLFPDARYVHIYRDPRDVASSTTRLGWSGNLYFGADFWLEAEASWAAAKPELDPACYAELCYEDLVANPEGELTRICDFLGLEFTEEMFDYARTSTYDLPDIKMVQQWKTRLSRFQIAQVERRCGPLMESLGYARVCPQARPAGPVAKAFWTADNKLRKVAAAIRFYGLRDYGLEKLFRLPGLQAHRTAVQLRMQETMNRSLK